MEGRDLSPFLNRGRTFDSFHGNAKIPSLKDLLKRIDKGTEISFSTAFNSLLLMPFGPVALFGFSNLIKDSTSLPVHEMSDK